MEKVLRDLYDTKSKSKYKSLWNYKKLYKLMSGIADNDIEEGSSTPKLVKKTLICKGCGKVMANYYGKRNSSGVCTHCHKLEKLKE